MTDERRRSRKREWASSPRQEPYGRGGYHGGGHSPPPWASGKRGRMDSRMHSWGGPPRFGGPRRGSPPHFEDTPSHRGAPRDWPPTWSGSTGPHDGGSGSRGARGVSAENRSGGSERRMGNWSGSRDSDRDMRDKDRDLGRRGDREFHGREGPSPREIALRHSSRESSPDGPRKRLPPPPPRKDRDEHDPSSEPHTNPRDRGTYFGSRGDVEEGRSSRSKWDSKSLHRTSTAPAYARETLPHLPPPPPLHRSISASGHSPRRASRRGSRSPPRRHRSEKERDGEFSASASRKSASKLGLNFDTEHNSKLRVTIPETKIDLEALPETAMSPVTPREEEQAEAAPAAAAESAPEKLAEAASRETQAPPAVETPVGLVEAEVRVTPVTDRSEGAFESGQTLDPQSDEPPKRKRLGWGQGLARLRSVDARPKDESGALSPTAELKDGELKEGEFRLDSVEETESAAPKPEDETPAGPQALLRTPEADPAEESAFQQAQATGTSGEVSKPVALPPVSSPVAALTNLLTSPKSPSSPPAALRPVATVPSLKLEEAAAPGSTLEAQDRQVSAAEKPSEPRVSKAAILAAIEKVDADHEVKSNALATLSKAQAELNARAHELDEEICRLQIPTPPPPPPPGPSSSSDEDMASEEEYTSSEAVISSSDEQTPPAKVPNGVHSAPVGDSLEDALSDSGASSDSCDSIVSVAPKPYLSYHELNNMYRWIFLENLRTAQDSAGAIGFSKDQSGNKKVAHDFPEFINTITRGRSNKQRIRRAVEARKQELLDKEIEVLLEYRELYKKWRDHLHGEFGRLSPIVPERQIQAAGPSGFRSASRKLTAAREEQEERSFSLQRMAVQRMHDLVLCLEVPDQIIDEAARNASVFPNDNALVSDPVAELELEKQIRPWSADEKRIFMDKFMAHPKDFYTIASFLEHRTTADCVVFYYQTQKLDDFATVRRKQQLKKRRQQSDANRGGSTRYMGVSTTPTATGLTRVTATAVAIPEAAKAIRAPRSMPRGPVRGRGGSIASAIALGLATGDHVPDQEMRQAEPLPESAHLWSDQDEVMLTEGFRIFGRDFGAISKHMGYSRTAAACKSYFSKHKVRLGLDKVVEEPEKERGDPKEDEPEGFKSGGAERDVPRSASVDEAGPSQQPAGREQTIQGAAFQPPYFSMPGSGPYQSLPFSASSSPAPQFPPGQAMPLQGGGMPSANQLSALIQMGMLQNAQQAAMQQMPGLQGYPGFVSPQLLNLLMGAMGSAPALPYAGQLSSHAWMAPSFGMLGGVPSQAMLQALGGAALPYPQRFPSPAHDGSGSGVEPPPNPPVRPAKDEQVSSEQRPPREEMQAEEPAAPEGIARRVPSMWTPEEKSAFLSCFKVHGRDWKRLAEAIPNKTETQIKNYFQNYKAKLGLDRMELPATAIHLGTRRKKLPDQSVSASTRSTTPPSTVADLSAAPPSMPQMQPALGEVISTNAFPITPSGPGHASFASQGRSQSYTIPAAQWRGQSKGQGLSDRLDGDRRQLQSKEAGREADGPADSQGPSMMVQNVLSLLGNQKAAHAGMDTSAAAGTGILSSLAIIPELAHFAALDPTSQMPAEGFASSFALYGAPYTGRTVTTGLSSQEGTDTSKDMGGPHFVRYASAPANLPMAIPSGAPPEEPMRATREETVRSASQPLLPDSCRQPHGRSEPRPSRLGRLTTPLSSKVVGEPPPPGPHPSMASQMTSGRASAALPPDSAAASQSAGLSNAIINEMMVAGKVGATARPASRAWPAFGTADALAALGSSQSPTESLSQLRPPAEWRRQQNKPTDVAAGAPSGSFLPAWLQQAALHGTSRFPNSATSLSLPQAQPGLEVNAESAPTSSSRGSPAPQARADLSRPVSTAFRNATPPRAEGGNQHLSSAHPETGSLDKPLEGRSTGQTLAASLGKSSAFESRQSNPGAAPGTDLGSGGLEHARQLDHRESASPPVVSDDGQPELKGSSAVEALQKGGSESTTPKTAAHGSKVSSGLELPTHGTSST